MWIKRLLNNGSYMIYIPKACVHLLAVDYYAFSNISVYANSSILDCKIYSYTWRRFREALLVEYTVYFPDAGGRESRNLCQQLVPTEINETSSAFLDKYHCLLLVDEMEKKDWDLHSAVAERQISVAM